MEWILLIAFIVISAAFMFFAASALRQPKDKQPYAKQEHIIEQQRREQFISIISHQLRTPLSIVRGYLEALANEDLGKLNDQQEEYVTEAKEINREMVDLVNRYLEVTSSKAKEITPEKAEFDLREFLEKATRHYETYAKASNIEFRSSVPQEKLFVYSDKKLLRNVLDNVINNAIKYSASSGIITLGISQDQKSYTISVADTGVGIPKEQHKEVFKKFFRGQNILHRSIAGSGLGLYIAKEYMTALSGDIRFESEEGKGTTVFIQLPK